MHRRRGSGGFVIVAGAGIVLLLVVLFRSGPRSEQMRQAARPTIQAIQRYAKRHGHFPASLAATGAAAPLTPYGRFRYQVAEDGSDCSLSVGSRFRDGFVLAWDCADGLWSMNPVLRVAPARLDSAALPEPGDTAKAGVPPA